MSITSIVNDTVTSVSFVNAQKPLPPTISGYSVGGLDDTALDPAGGQTVQINGTGFLAGATITFDGSAVAVVTYVNSNQLTFTSPAKTAGTYTIYAVNPDGGTAIYIPGIIYSVLPTWTTAAGTLGSYYETTSISNTVVASGDAPITYSLYSGSLPTGSTLYANGVITGTAPVDSSSTTYSFTIQATDAQLQDSTRSFSLTINVDAVTWVSPANNTTYTSAVDSAIANVTLSATDAAGYAVSYSANALPTGLSLSGANISGTPTVIADSSTLLTATAATTNRSATRTINWSITVANDPYFEYNTLLIPGASTTFVDDASTNNFAVTVNGDTKPNSLNPYSPGYYSFYSPTANDYYSFSDTSSGNFGTGDFTVEGWFYLTASAHNLTQPASATSSWGFITYGNQLYWQENGGNYGGVGYGTVPQNQWVHLAVSRTGGFLNLYINGTRVLNSANTFNYSGTPTRYIGPATGGTNAPFWLSNIRFIKGTGIYSGTTITVPTSPLTAVANTSLLTCQSNRMIDNSTNAVTFNTAGSPVISSFQPFTPNSSYSTYGSGYFDGTGDSLTWGSFAPGGNFTFECWFYATVYTQSQNILFATPWPGGNFQVIVNNNNTVMWQAYTQNSTDSNAPITRNTWYHLAVVKNGSSAYLYLNGVLKDTSTLTNSISGTATIGARNDGYNFAGYISDMRVVIGTAVYTANFTPPTAPLTAITNTSLLTLQNNQSVNNNVFLDNSSNNFLVTRNGNTTQGTFSPYGGNWSNYFDGSSTAYIQTPAGSTTAILGTAGGGITPTATFTIECWIYQTQRQTALVNPVLIGDQGVNGSLYWTFGPDSSGKLAFYHYTGTTLSATGNDTIPLNTWTHIAVSISSGLIKLFVNGNLQTITGTSTTGSQAGTFGYLLTGGFYTFSGGYSYIGNLSNLRIVKSALYSTTFTPSTTPLTPITNTGLLMSQSARFIDNSPNAFALTTGSTLSVQRFSPFNPSSLTPTSYSGYFDGTGDVLNITGAAGPEGTQDFTWESWWYFTSLGGQYPRIFEANTASGFQIYSDSGTFGVASNGGSIIVSYNISALTNQWLHLCVTRSGSAMRLFVNGVLRAYSASGGTNFASSTDWRVYSEGGGPIGYLSNMRVVRGSVVAGYVTASTTTGTTIFTPPTSPLTAISGTSLLTCQSPTFIDNSTNNFPITTAGNSQPLTQNPFGYTSATTNGYTVSTIGGSGYFDGTGDTISVPFSSAISLGTSNFTMEAWCYPTTTTNGIDSIWGSGNYSIMLYHNGTSWTLEVGDGGGNYFTINGTAPIYAWNHMAVTRSGSTFNLWINGVSAGTGTTAGTMKTSGTLVIGGNGNGQNFTGYITDFRLVKGTALYTSSFVPPSAPLLAVQNTVLLNNMTSAGIYDAAMMNNMETVSDAKLSTAVSKFGGSSMYFDGNDNLSIPLNTTLMNIGTGDFTIEGWVYHLDSGTYSGYYYGGTNGVVLRRTDANKLEISHDGVASIIVSTTSIPSNQWVFVTGTRSGSTVRIFINGTIAGTATYGTSIVGTSAGTVGSIVNIAGYYMNGYIDDLRITKGYARYTANFTAPTSAFQLY